MEKTQENTLVLVDEEYGYQYHYWFTTFTPESLIRWWKQVKSVESWYMNPSAVLNRISGVIQSVEDTEEDFITLTEKGYPYLHLHSDDDSFLSVGGRVYFIGGREKAEMAE